MKKAYAWNVIENIYYICFSSYIFSYVYGSDATKLMEIVRYIIM